MSLASVVLPEPLAPTSATTSPGSIVIETPGGAGAAPAGYVNPTSSTTIRTGSATPPTGAPVGDGGSSSVALTNDRKSSTKKADLHEVRHAVAEVGQPLAEEGDRGRRR